MVCAIFANVIEMNDDGEVINAKHAEKRAAQWLRSYMDPTYEVSPPFKDWEVELHDPPTRFDPKLA